MWKKLIPCIIAGCLCFPESSFAVSASSTTVDDYKAFPPFLTTGSPPLVMLVMGRNHKLYYEAYNDATDLNEDGILDVGYKPSIDYYGYFDSHKCYTYVSANNRFEPTVVTADKTCSGTTEWSGDFLNYVTMSRMDTIRKVLYGGFRSTDTASETVLQRSYIPQDAHSWGKEYNPGIDSYNISDYTPLSAPLGNTRHIFVNTTLTSETSPPLLRVLENSVYRVWDWVACEVPVAGSRVINGSTGPLVTDNGVVSSAIDETDGGTGGTATDIGNNPASETIVELFDDNVNTKWLTFSSPPVWVQFEFDTPKQIRKYSLTTANDVENRDPKSWTLQASNDGSTWVTVDTVTDGLLPSGRKERKEFTCSDPPAIPYTYYKLVITDRKGGSSTDCPSSRCSQIAEMELIENTGVDPTPANATLTDYEVRVKVCDGSIPESNCKLYPDGDYKPTGLLQRHGESNRMYFGLMSGSYTHNTKGGVLRKNIGSIRDEINVDSDGTFNPSTNGIVQTINKFRIDDFDYGSHSYNSNCGWITTRAINDGECRMWGNPIGEIMYESLRYFAGESSPTAAFDYTYSPTDNTLDDNELRLPKPDWIDPYTLEDADGDGVIDGGEDLNGNGQLDGFPSCAKPFILVISDINPTYDSDDLPGVNTNFGSLPAAPVGNAATPLDVEALSNTIGSAEEVAGDHYIGQKDSTSDGACTAKALAGLGDIRGLCPEEPTKKGSYYAAAVAYYGKKEDLHATGGDQKVTTYTVGLASPLPRIEIPIAGKTITLVPFAKSIAGSGISAAAGQFQPTNTIVDFFVETMDLMNGYGKFRINYEDVEQGADHDMDFVVIYEYQTVDNLGNPVLAADPEAAGIKITVTHDYAAGGITQIAGYIISGTIAGNLGPETTTGDGIYLEVRDENASAPAYYLDTPPGVGPGQSASGVHPLPLTNSRIFVPNPNPDIAAATLLENPLYFAAKWGGFEDKDSNQIPNLSSEWDEDNNGTPDTYFYVVNPLRLEEQLNSSFASILQRTSSGTAASVISSSRSGEGAIYQAVFFPAQIDNAGREINWAGDIHALWMDSYGNIREDCGDPACGNPCDPACSSDHILNLETDNIVTFYTDSAGAAKARRFRDDNGDGEYDDKACSDSSYTTEDDCTGASETWDYSFSPDFVGENVALQDIRYLWSGGNWLAAATSTTQRVYSNTASERYIFTWFGTGDAVPFTTSDLYTALAADPDKYSGYLNAADVTEANRIVNYLRGEDQTGFRSRLIDWDGDGAPEIYKLGDIVHSTPTIVSRPAEDYDVIYGDDSYRAFRKQYKNRRTIIYAGGNDGGLHAFNGGYYDQADKKFHPALPIPGIDPVQYETTEYDLGAEMWMFIPFNLLPHLKWLTNADYNADNHVYYVDLKPKVLDAKIFDPDDGIHTGGWGTVLVGGMRFGGGDIEIDTDGDGNDDKNMRSAYFILDITNPECPPVILAEFPDPNDPNDPDLGFTTSFPAAIPMLKCTRGVDCPTDQTVTTWPMNWYLAFGSGPHDATDPQTALEGRSDQKAKLFVLKLGGTASTDYVYTTVPHPLSAGACPSMITNKNPPSLVAGYPKEIAPMCSDPSFTDDASGTGCTAHGNTWEDFPKSFFGDLITVDFNLSYQADTLYMGSVTYTDDPDPGNDKGGMHRFVINNTDTPGTWDFSTLLNVGQPVSAAPATAYDGLNYWLYFGTGRFFSQYDKGSTSTQSFYGVKEQDRSGVFDLTAPSDGDLVDVSSLGVYSGGTLYGTLPLQSTGGGTTSGGIPLTSPTLDLGVTTFTGLKNEMANYDGWKIDFDSNERNLGQAAVLGDIVSFTTYLPSTDLCTAEGDSYLWAPYYKTGTSYFRSVIGKNYDDITGQYKITRKTALGGGLSTTPNIHSGAGEGTKAFVQTSTGAIIGIEQANPGIIKSGPAAWRELLEN